MDKNNVSYVILDNINRELSSIAQKGLNVGNLDITYKLVEIYYRLSIINSMETKHETDSDYEYQQAKRKYRKHCCDGTRSEVMDCLNRKIDELETEIKELWKDADFEEERALIERLRGGY